MNDSVLVCRFEGLRELLEQRQRLIERDHPRRTRCARFSPGTSSISSNMRPPMSCSPISVAMFGWFDDPSSPRLSIEAATPALVGGEQIRQDLDRHFAAEQRLSSSAIHLAHPARAEH